MTWFIGNPRSAEGRRTLQVHLALLREVDGRMAWEPLLLPRPLERPVIVYAARAARLQAAGIPVEASVLGLPAAIAEQSDTDQARRQLDRLRSELAALRGLVETAVAEADTRLELSRREARLAAVLAQHEDAAARAIGCAKEGAIGPISLVPWGPHPPSVGLIHPRRPGAGAWIAANRFTEEADLQLSLALSMQAALTEEAHGSDNVRNRFHALVPGRSPEERRLVRVAEKIIIGATAAHYAKQAGGAGHDVNRFFGVHLRYERLFDPLTRRWAQYLDGRADWQQVWKAIADLIASHPAWWYVDQIDAASLAADYYLLESMSASGIPDATAALAEWQPELAARCAEHVALAIGAELSHMSRAQCRHTAPSLRSFVERLRPGHSLMHWPYIHDQDGREALQLAEAAFSGPGLEFGGEAWAPLAALLSRYTAGTVNDRVFVDQCFTLEHNNGSVFDKFFATSRTPAVLDAQAEGDLDTLATHASDAVRSLYRSQGTSSVTTIGRLWRHPSEIRLGDVGCGSLRDPRDGENHAEIPDESSALRLRGGLRGMASVQPPTETWLILHSSVGDIRINLRTRTAPETVRNLVDLALGRTRWQDPRNGAWRDDPFYDGLAFHRVIQGFLAQVGDRQGDGFGGAGLRRPDEPSAFGPFDRPGIVAMANLGRNTNGSQFFITGAPCPHLDGGFCIVGELMSGDDDTHAAMARVFAAGEGTGAAVIERVSAG